MLFLSSTQGVFRVNPATGIVARLGPLDTSVEALAVASDGRTIIAAFTPDYGLPMRRTLRPSSHPGAVRTTDAGLTWSPIEALSHHQITALASVNPPVPHGGAGNSSLITHHSSLVVCGTDPAELLVSRDGGATWTQGQSLREMPGYADWTYPLPPHTPHVMLITPHPTEPSVLYAGIEVGSIVRSDDAGATWRVMGDQGGRRTGAVHPDIHGLAISPSSPNVLYCATPEGVYYSDDAGETWDQRIDGLDLLYCRPIAVHQLDANVAIVVATNGASGFFGIPAERTGGAVFRTDNAGRTWHRITTGLPDPLAPTPTIAADPTIPGRLYLPLFSGDVLLSDNFGATWHTLTTGLPSILRSVTLLQPNVVQHAAPS